jgi:hypothetical protein
MAAFFVCPAGETLRLGFFRLTGKPGDRPRLADRSGPFNLVAQQCVQHRAAVGRQHQPAGAVTVN